MDKDFTDELIHFTIHEHDFEQLPQKIKKLLEDYRDLEFYKDGLKKGKKFDKVKEAKKLIRDYEKEIKSKNGAEGNIECMIVGQLFELLNRMMAKDVRRLKLGRLLRD